MVSCTMPRSWPPESSNTRSDRKSPPPVYFGGGGPESWGVAEDTRLLGQGAHIVSMSPQVASRSSNCPSVRGSRRLTLLDAGSLLVTSTLTWPYARFPTWFLAAASLLV